MSSEKLEREAAQVLANTLYENYGVVADIGKADNRYEGIIRFLYMELTNREVEVAARLIQGKSNNDIAKELNCSNETVNKHGDSIYRKIDVKGRGDLTWRVLEYIVKSR